MKHFKNDLKQNKPIKRKHFFDPFELIKFKQSDIFDEINK
jgi:hypothetical protein